MTTQTNGNPYVGPRTFEREQAHLFFGRDQEARDLLARVVSERLLLFYAQSGAGKSSLINTRLIPALEEEGFAVLPVGRVSGELPAGLSQVDNIFLFNLMFSLDQGGGDASRLAQLTLSEFLARLTSEDGERWKYDESIRLETEPSPVAGSVVGTAMVQPFVLIVDQFEELITTHLDRWQERETFFYQLNQALLDDPNLWVVLTLREDYVAALDPYAPLLFSRLRARFYMERMGKDAALEAVLRPAEVGKRPFATGVAEQLVDNLRQVRVPGLEDTIPGQYVEPVQLQVVCYQLWENIKNRPPGAITLDDLLEAGDVDRALTQFYEETLAAVLADPQAPVTERQLRLWFDTELITEIATRGLVRQGDQETGSLPNAVVRKLQGRFLVRAEARSGDTWIELVHDRFVEPIRESNRAWFARNLNPLTQAAQAWRAAGHDPSKLYTGSQLAAAALLLQTNPDEFGELEQEFVDEGQKVESRRVVRRQRMIAQGAAALALVFIVLAGLALLSAIRATKAQGEARRAQGLAEAEADARATEVVERGMAQATAEAAKASAEAARMEARRSLAGQLASQADTARVSNPALGSLLAIAAMNLSVQDRDVPLPLAYQSLYNTLTTSGTLPMRLTMSQDSAIQAIVSGPDAQSVVTADGNGNLVFWRLPADGTAVSTNVLLAGVPISRIATSPDHRWLVASSTDAFKPGVSRSSVNLWKLDADNLSRPLAVGSTEVAAVSLAISPNDAWLIAGLEDGSIRIWPIPKDGAAANGQGDTPASLEPPIMIRGHEGAVKAMDVSQDGRWLFTGSSDTTIRIWDLQAAVQSVPTVLRKHSAGITDVAVSPDERWLATGDSKGRVFLWSLAANGPGKAQRPGVQAGTVDLDRIEDRGTQLLQHDKEVTAIAFSPDSQWLVTAGADGVARLWNLLTNRPEQKTLTLHGQKDGITDVAFDPAGHWLAASGRNEAVVYLWDLASDDPAAHPVRLQLNGTGSSTYAVATTPGGARLLAAGDFGTTLVWDLNVSQLTDLACQLAGRNLQLDEWKQYFPDLPYPRLCPKLSVHRSVVDNYLREGRSLASQGYLNEARDQFQRALELEPGQKLDATSEIRQSLVSAARALARQGDVEGALARYGRANQQDSTLSLDADELQRIAEAQALLLEGRGLAAAGDTDTALDRFRRAGELDPSLAIDPTTLVESITRRGEVSFGSDYLFGLFEPGGEGHMIEAGKPGWIVFTEAIGHDPADQSGKDFSQWSSQGLGVIVTLVNGYYPAGTVPHSTAYEDFAKRCANYVRASRGAAIWEIGNEMNHPVERPGVDIDWESGMTLLNPGEVLTPERYARAYQLCRDAIHQVPGHENDQVLIGAVAPWNNLTKYPGNETGDWVTYFEDILNELGPGNVDGISLHTRNHGSDPAEVHSDFLMDRPFETRQYNFRAYQDFMNAIPATMRQLPVYITQTDQDVAWKDANTGWIQRAYAEINGWNSQPGAQKIRALVLYRWPNVDRWVIEGKNGVIQDFRQALMNDYRWSLDRTAPPLSLSTPVGTIVYATDEVMLFGKPTLVGTSAGSVVGSVPFGEPVAIAAGPSTQDGLIWWQVTYRDADGTVVEGWTPQADFGGRTLLSDSVPVQEPPERAALPTTFAVGQAVCNISGEALSVRKSPGYIEKPADDNFADIPAKGRAAILGGPTEKDGLIWWQVNTAESGQGVAGWVVMSTTNGARMLAPAEHCDLTLAKPYEGDYSITQVFGDNPQVFSQFSYEGVPLRGNPGIDIGAPEGTGVLATDDGVVIDAKTASGFLGNYVKIQHKWGESVYTHLQELRVYPGQEVKRGDLIARSGSSGMASGPFLGFEIRISPYLLADGWGGFSDPLPFLEGQGDEGQRMRAAF